MADILGSTASGAASGAAMSGGNPYAIAGGAAIGLVTGLMGASAEKKAQQAKAAALAKQAERRLFKGRQEAQGIKTQGQLSQTSYMADALSRGISREILVQDMGMDEIANRATYEANLAMEDAEYEAQMIREDIDASNANFRSGQRASLLEGGLSALGTYARYQEASGGRETRQAEKKYAQEKKQSQIRSVQLGVDI